jgi:hypothetical protein
MFGVMYVFGDGCFYLMAILSPKNVRFELKDLDFI